MVSQLFYLSYGKLALWTITYLAKMFCSKNACGKDAIVKVLDVPFGSQSWEKQNTKGQSDCLPPPEGEGSRPESLNLLQGREKT